MGHVGSGPQGFRNVRARSPQVIQNGTSWNIRLEQTLPKASPNLFIGAAVVVRGPGVGAALAIHGKLFGNRTSG